MLGVLHHVEPLSIWRLVDPAAEKGGHAGIDREREDHLGGGEEEGGAEEQDLAPRRTNLVGDERPPSRLRRCSTENGIFTCPQQKGVGTQCVREKKITRVPVHYVAVRSSLDL